MFKNTLWDTRPFVLQVATRVILKCRAPLFQCMNELSALTLLSDIKTHVSPPKSPCPLTLFGKWLMNLTCSSAWLLQSLHFPLEDHKNNWCKKISWTCADKLHTMKQQRAEKVHSDRTTHTDKHQSCLSVCRRASEWVNEEYCANEQMCSLNNKSHKEGPRNGCGTYSGSRISSPHPQYRIYLAFQSQTLREVHISVCLYLC